MNKLRSFSKKGVVAVVMAMLMTIPNLTVYSSVGDYATQSSALQASSIHTPGDDYSDTASWQLAAAAGAVLSATYTAGFAIGRIASYIFGGPNIDQAPTDSNYAPANFTKFDN